VLYADAGARAHGDAVTMTLPGWTADASVRRFPSDYRSDTDVALAASPKGIVPAGSITLGWGDACQGCLWEPAGLPCWCVWTD
jgi:hypothetical protein